MPRTPEQQPPRRKGISPQEAEANYIRFVKSLDVLPSREWVERFNAVVGQRPELPNEFSIFARKAGPGFMHTVIQEKGTTK